MTTTNTKKKYIRTRIHVFPEFLSHPAIQAYWNSPHWSPVVVNNNIIYVWPDCGTHPIEAVFPISFGPCDYCLLFRSRKNSRIFVTPISEIKIPGGRYHNLSKKFIAVYNANRLKLAFAIVLTGSIENACKLINASKDISYSLDLNYIIIEHKEGQEEEVKSLLLTTFEEVEEE